MTPLTNYEAYLMKVLKKMESITIGISDEDFEMNSCVQSGRALAAIICGIAVTKTEGIVLAYSNNL